MKSILSLIIGGALVVSGFGQTRNVLVGTNNAVSQPTNFWSADAVNARAGLGLGTAATNAASAFQPSSLTLSNLAANNGGGLTNLNATNIVGILSVAQGGTGSTNASDARTALGLGTAATNPATAFQSSSTALSNLATGNGGALSNLQATNLVGVIPASNISTVTFTNISGTLSIASGGTGATNAASARQNLGSTTVGDAVFIATNAAAARTAIGALADGVIAITNGGSGATTAGEARTNFGLTWTGLTNPSASTFRSALEIGTTNTLTIAGLVSQNLTISAGGGITLQALLTNAASFRTNIGLGWSALTNTSSSGFQSALFGANTNPVLVDSNGEVVSPTNFWQVAPITTTFIESQPTVSQTTNIPAGRNLHIHSLAISTVGVTNTIALPITGSFNGDIALVVHEGPTSSVTAVRQAGAGTNLITLNQFDEAVEFVFYNNVWQFNHNRSFIEPIYFSGTNAAANAAASRTNLGLGATWLTNTNLTNFNNAIGLFPSTEEGGRFSAAELFDIPNGNTALSIQDNEVFIDSGAVSSFRTALGLGATWLTNTNVTNFRTAIGLGATNVVTFNGITATNFIQTELSESRTFYVYDGGSIDFEDAGTINFGNAAPSVRTNLGLPLAALTNTSNTNFQAAVFTTNAAPTNSANVNSVNFNTAVKWMEVTLNISGTNQVFRIPLFQ